MRTLVAVTALCFSGAVLPFISMPVGWVWLHPVSWAPALLVLSRVRGARAFFAGWLLGTAANAAIFYWIVHTVRTFTNLGAAVAAATLLLFALATGLQLAVFGWGLPRVRARSGRRWPFGIAAWFTACEFVFPHLFPNPQGSVWNQLPSLFLVSSLTGVAGVTFLALACNALVVQGIETARERSPAGFWVFGANAAGFVALVAGALVWSSLRIERIDEAESGAEALRVALVQPGTGPGERRALLRAGATAVARDLVALSRQALERDPEIDVLVWPEKILLSSPMDPRNRAVLQFVRDTGVEVWTGGGHSEQVDGGRRNFNSAYRVHGRGSVDRRYDKIVLMPFGEFMPLMDVWPALQRIRGPGNFSAGEEIFVYDDAPARFAFLVCYEAILSDLVREAVQQDADLLVNLTFDGWFGDTAEPGQHLMMSASQAALFGVPLVRSTTTGISAFVDARGRITEQSELLARQVIVADVKPLRVPSPYARWGEWFAWGCVLASAALLAPRRPTAPRGPPRGGIHSRSLESP